jgi:hypothetical protein
LGRRSGPVNSQDKEDLKKVGAVGGVIAAIITAVATLSNDDKKNQKS